MKVETLLLLLASCYLKQVSQRYSFADCHELATTDKSAHQKQSKHKPPSPAKPILLPKSQLQVKQAERMPKRVLSTLEHESFHHYPWDGQPSSRGYLNGARLGAETNSLGLNRSPLDQAGVANRQRQSTRRFQVLPNGPPPLIPSPVALKLGSLILRPYKPQVASLSQSAYRAYHDSVRQLKLLIDAAASQRVRTLGAKIMSQHLAATGLLSKWKRLFKLNWPLVMLNPNFVKELLSNPTFLVMLFHTIELAHASSAKAFWLKPLVRLVAQPSHEKEEQIWWRRKRLYDTLNGHGSSELQPNLKTKHFQHPGRPASIAIPRLAGLVRLISNKEAPNPNSYHQPLSVPLNSKEVPMMAATSMDDLRDHNQGFLPKLKANTLVELEKGHTLVEDTYANSGWQSRPGALMQQVAPMAQQDDWLSLLPSKDQLMSAQEFEALEPREREQVIRQARLEIEESRWINDLIKQHQDFVDSLAKRSDGKGSS